MEDVIPCSAPRWRPLPEYRNSTPDNSSNAASTLRFHSRPSPLDKHSPRACTLPSRSRLKLRFPFPRGCRRSRPHARPRNRLNAAVAACIIRSREMVRQESPATFWGDIVSSEPSPFTIRSRHLGFHRVGQVEPSVLASMSATLKPRSRACIRIHRSGVLVSERRRRKRRRHRSPRPRPFLCLSRHHARL